MNLDRLPRLFEALAAGRAEGLHLGAQVYVSRHGEVIADAAFGDNAEGEALRPDHLMLWLSSTKPIAALALGQLWERGLLELDDPVARHLPEFAAQGKEGITLRHLLTHTAGIRMLDTGWPAAPWEEIVARIAGSRPEPRWVPGQKAGYHLASSWFILGEVVHRADGRRFEQYVREEIFLPLGLADCWIGMPAERYRDYAAEGRLGFLYNTEQAPPRRHNWTSEERLTACHPGGNGYGPIRGLGRIYEMLLARGAGAGDGTRLLRPQTVEALTVRHRVGMIDQTFKHEIDWGLGFILDSRRHGAETVPYGYGHYASPRTFGHSGYRSSVGFADPERGLAVAMVVNGTPGNEAHENRVRLLLDGIYADLELSPND